MLCLLYNEKIQEFSTFLDCSLNLFNVYRTVIKYHKSPIIEQSLMLSKAYFAYNFFIFGCLLIIVIFIICTMIHTFRESAYLDESEEDNEVLNKIGEIEEQIEKLTRRKKDTSLNNYNNLKQIIWLSFHGVTELYSEKLIIISQDVKKDSKCPDNKILLFNTSNQIISFFKYLFAIKPKLQFKNLENKFAIVIECDSNKEYFTIQSQQLLQIYLLFDWLTFAGCKIPVAIFTDNHLEKNLRMDIINKFFYVSFINDKFDLDSFLQINSNIEEFNGVLNNHENANIVNNLNLNNNNNHVNNFNNYNKDNMLKTPLRKQIQFNNNAANSPHDNPIEINSNNLKKKESGSSSPQKISANNLNDNLKSPNGNKKPLLKKMNKIKTLKVNSINSSDNDSRIKLI